MAGLDTLNWKHNKYIDELIKSLQSQGYIVDNWGLENVAPKVSQSGIREDFSLEALRLRTGFDLLVRCPETGFVCELDGKTIMFRQDTGNCSVEIWPVLFGRQSSRPRLIVFEAVDDYALWLDQIDITLLSRYFMPDRWDDHTLTNFRHYINNLTLDIDIKAQEIAIEWKQKQASGDPFYAWPINSIKSQGKHFLSMIQDSAGLHTQENSSHKPEPGVHQNAAEERQHRRHLKAIQYEEYAIPTTLNYLKGPIKGDSGDQMPLEGI